MSGTTTVAAYAAQESSSPLERFSYEVGELAPETSRSMSCTAASATAT